MQHFTARQLGFPPMLDVDARIKRRQTLSEAECGALIALGPHERYDYALKCFCQKQELWTAWQGDEMLIFGQDGSSLRTPLFPHHAFAEIEFRGSGIDNAEFVPIPLDDFIDEIVPQLDHRFAVDVFPGVGDVVRVSTADFILDLSGAWEHVHSQELSLDPQIADAFREQAARLINGRMRRLMRTTRTGYKD